MITKQNLNEFRDFGATCIRGVLKNENLDEIEIAIDKNISNPSSMFRAFEKNDNDEFLFFNDFNNWRRIQEIKKICFNKNLALTAKRLMNSKEVRLFHDHVIIKKAGSREKTPWHADKTYFMVDGEKTVSLWVPTHDVSKDESLVFAKGSHKDRSLIMPRDFKTNSDLEHSDIFKKLDEKEILEKYETISWEVRKGDILAFSYYTLHTAPEVLFDYDRKAMSIRYFGDDTLFDARIKNPAPPFTQIGYRGEHGDKLKYNWFPEVETR